MAAWDTKAHNQGTVAPDMCRDAGRASDLRTHRLISTVPFFLAALLGKAAAAAASKGLAAKGSAAVTKTAF